MKDLKELKAQVHFAEGCRVYQSGLNAKEQGKWPEVRKNMSLNEVLKETKEAKLPQKDLGR